MQRWVSAVVCAAGLCLLPMGVAGAPRDRVTGAAMDLAIAAAPDPLEYARAPLSLVGGFAIQPAALVSNVGGVEAVSVTATATLHRDGIPFGAPVDATPLASLAPGADAMLAFPVPFVITAEGQWTIAYALAPADGEVSLDDNVAESLALEVGGWELSRYRGLAAGTIGAGGGAGGEIGVRFTLPVATEVAAIRFGMGALDMEDWDGFQFIARLRSFDGETPGDVIATTLPMEPVEGPVVYLAELDGGPVALQPGSYLAAVVEPVGAFPMRVPTYNAIFGPEQVWVIAPGSGVPAWIPIETLGAGFERTPEIGLVTSLVLFADGFEVP